MRAVLVLLALSVLLAAPARAEGFGWAALSPDAARAEIETVRRAMGHAYPGFGRFASRADFEADLDALSADPPGDAGALYAGLARALAGLRDSHLVLAPDARWARHAGREAIYAPWRCDIVEGRLHVVAVADVARAAGLNPGDELLEIDGRPVAEHLDAARALVAQDGANDRARDARLCAAGGAGGFPGSGLDHYSAILSPPGAVQVLTARAPDGAARTLSVPRLTLSELGETFGGAWSGQDEGAARALLYLPLSGSAAYLRVARFDSGREGRTLLARAFEDMFARGVETLILDLRGNAGGSSLMALTLLRYLSDDPVRLVTLAVSSAPDLSAVADIVRADARLMTPDGGLLAPMAGGVWRAHGRAFDGMLAEHAPLQPIFRGVLYVLTDPLTDSSAALAAAKLKASGRAALIGEETGGGAQGPVGGMFAALDLPHSGHVLHIPLLRQYAQPAEHPDQGVTPDIALRPSLSDLESGRDAVLIHALELAQAPKLAQAPARPGPPVFGD